MPKPPDALGDENGKEEEKSVWEKAGFEDEAAMIESAKDAKTLRSEKETADAELEKEKAARSKTDAEFMRQSNEIGELRKKLKGGVDDPANKDDAKIKESDEDLLKSLSEEEITVFDDILNKPENVDLKKRVASGGDTAMAEFVRAYRKEAPVELDVSLFAKLKTAKKDAVPKASIAKAVQELFKQHNKENVNNLAATTRSGIPAERRQETTQEQTLVGVGNLDASFFKKKS